MKMSSAGFLVLVLVLLVTCSEAEPATEFTEATDGGSASLPCHLTPARPLDRVTVVVWHKDTEEDPIYMYDLRGNGPTPRHEASKDLEKRYFLRVLDDDRAVLTISPTRLSDEGQFHCRVDFLSSPTRITHVNLTIVVCVGENAHPGRWETNTACLVHFSCKSEWEISIRSSVPPTGVQVSDDLSVVKNGITSAYAEGASLTLTCTATGGKPLAKVSWWKENRSETNDTQFFPDRRKSQSILKIDKLNRSHLLAIYSCEVSNSKMQPPLVVRVAVDMYLRPLEVTLMGNNPEFSAGKRYNITCRSRGSRPPATITWWKDGVSMEGGIVTASADSNTTMSTLAFTPSSADHGLILTCRASNQLIPFSEMTRTWMLRVNYPPKVTLTLGHGLDTSVIKEGSDVYFECHLTANPWVHRVWWLRDGGRLLSNATAGVIVSNQTLVLQSVSRASSGRYCCEATNKEGTSTSPPFHLRVKFPPVCSERGNRKVLGAAKDEPLKVECKVDGEPQASFFRWSFNSTPGISRELSEFTAEEGSSVLTYVPRVAADYGTIQCWGRNEIGSQNVPCTFHIVPAGKPEPPHTCAPSNFTHHSVLLTCKKGFDGGLRQKFKLVLTLGEETVANMTSSVPEFFVTSLEAAQDYSATVYSYNSKGESKNPPVTIKTLPAPGLKEQRRSTGPSDGDKGGTGPWLYILLAAGSTLIVAGAVGAIIFVVRRFRVDSPVRERRRPRSPKLEESPLNPRVPPPYTDPITDDNNPDLIPPTNESLLDSSMVPYTITPRPSSKRNCATQMPVKPYHVTWAPILQSRNCATQTPPPHKESSV